MIPALFLPHGALPSAAPPVEPWTAPFDRAGLPPPLTATDCGDYGGTEFPGGFGHRPGLCEENLSRLLAMRAKIDGEPPGPFRDIVEHHWGRLEVAGLKFLAERERALADARKLVATGQYPRAPRSLLAAREREGRAWRALCGWVNRL